MSIQRINSTYRGKPTHFYRIDGVKADGVTTLIGGGLPKPALVGWGIKSVSEYVADNVGHVRDCFDWMDREQLVGMLKQSPYSQRDAAAHRGTEVHRLAEMLMLGEEIQVPDELAGYVDSCVRFLDEWKPTPVLTEAVVATRKWNVCGTLDFVADFPDGVRRLVDYKTSRSGIFGETALQLAAYAHADVYLDKNGAEQPVADLGIQAGMAVWIRADGYECYPVDISEDTYKTFLHVCYVARKAKTLKELIGEATSLRTEGAA